MTLAIDHYLARLVLTAESSIFLVVVGYLETSTSREKEGVEELLGLAFMSVLRDAIFAFERLRASSACFRDNF